MSKSRFQRPPTPKTDSLFPGCLIVSGDLASSLPLEHTIVKAEITGPLADVSVTQHFTNPLREPAELTYLFPLPHTAALSSFEIRLGSRVIHGELQELETARRAYEDAVQQGQQAGLAEQRMEGLYSVSLANVLPGEAIYAIFRYHERIKFDDNAYEFVLPMGLTPKYHSPLHPEEGDGVDAPLATPGERIGDVSIEVLLHPGLPYGDPTSPSHHLAIEETREGGLRIYLASPALPDHDFVLRLPVTTVENVLSAWRATGENGDYFLAILQPPDIRSETTEPLPRQFIFVLDRSGSMGGQPIAQARNALRACLRTLNPGDEFALQLFDNVVEWYKPAFTPVTQSEVDAADRFLAMVEGRGGTEIVGALHEALTFSKTNAEKLRYVVFLTDGAVSADERSLREINRLLGSARLFTFGIGPSVNRPLLSRIASLGRGTSEFLQLDEDIEGAVIRFQDRLAFPALTDLQLSAENVKLWDIYPSPLPDAYVGQPVVVTGRIKTSGDYTQRLTLKGQRAGEPMEIHFGLPYAADNPAVTHAWAQARLDTLIERSQQEGKSSERSRSEIIGLALDYHLASPYTAFVAIDRDSRISDGKPRRVRISQPLPQGLEIAGFSGHPRALMSQMVSLSMPPTPSPRGKQSKDMNMSVDYSIAPDMDLPAFMRKRPQHVSDTEAALPANPQDLLRLLARAQKLDGCWEEDVEHTAIALLFFLRQGQTTTRGSFRVAIQRASLWLRQHPASGLAELARLQALVELERSFGQNPDIAWVQTKLKPNITPEENALLSHLLAGEPLLQTSQIVTADELRLAALAGQKLSITSNPAQWFPPEWAAVWKALVDQA